jgi:hypothetical protein
MQRFGLAVQRRPGGPHHGPDRLGRFGRDPRELALIPQDVEDRLPSDDFLAGSVRPDQLVRGRRRVRGEPLHPHVLGVAVGDRVDEPIAEDDVGIDGFAVQTLEARGHEEGARPREMAEQTLVRLGRGDVRLVDHDQVHVVWREFSQQVVGVGARPQRVEIGDHHMRPEQFLAGHASDRAFVTVERQHARRRATRDERTARQPIQDVAHGLMVERSVEGAPDHAPRGDDERAAARERQARGNAERRLASPPPTYASCGLPAGEKVVAERVHGLDLALAQRAPIQAPAHRVEVACVVAAARGDGSRARSGSGSMSGRSMTGLPMR